jgi:hypothetical protein
MEGCIHDSLLSACSATFHLALAVAVFTPHLLQHTFCLSYPICVTLPCHQQVSTAATAPQDVLQAHGPGSTGEVVQAIHY